MLYLSAEEIYALLDMVVDIQVAQICAFLPMTDKLLLLLAWTSNII